MIESRNSLRAFSTPRGVDNPADQSKARVTFFSTLPFVMANMFLLLVAIIAPIETRGVLVASLIASLLTTLLICAVARTQNWRFAAALLSLYLVIIASAVIMTGLLTGLLLIVPLPFIYVGLIYGIRGLLVLLAYFTGALLASGFISATGTPVFTIIPVFLDPRLLALMDSFLLLTIMLLLVSFLREQRRLSDYASRLFAQLRATSEVAQTTTTILNVDELLTRTVDYIRDRFGFYHVQIFLLDDDRRYAELVASTGDVGRELMRRGHRLAVGSQSIIGHVTLTGEPTVAQDIERDPTHLANELLPETQSELALPLIAGDQLIGTLDVQSTHASAFLQEDIDSLQIMATQVSIAIRNAQLFEEQHKSLNENRRLFLEAETNLREIERLNQRLTGGAWDEYLRGRESSVIGFTLQGDDLTNDTTWTPGLAQAAEERHAVIEKQAGRTTLAIPIELRGWSLGALEVELGDNIRQAEVLEMMQSVAQRLALSVDNARLFEEAQQAAQQELEINAISAKLQGVTEVDDLLQTALAELGRALGADQASVRLGATLKDKVGSLAGNGHNGQSNGTVN